MQCASLIATIIFIISFYVFLAAGWSITAVAVICIPICAVHAVYTRKSEGLFAVSFQEN